MREPYEEGVATHFGPESCVPVREGGGEALTGVRAGPVWSREIDLYLRVPTFSKHGEGYTGRSDSARTSPDPARSETWCMLGNSLHGNREIPLTPQERWAWGRAVNPKGARQR